MLDSARWAALLEPGLREIATTALLGRPAPVLDRLFGRRASSKLTEHYLMGGGMGEVPVFDGSVEYRDPDSAWKTNITNVEFALGFQVRRSWIDDGQYNLAVDEAVGLGSSFALTREKRASDVFNKAFVTTGYPDGQPSTGGDGVALVSASHPLSPEDPGSVQSNSDTLPLTLDNFDTARIRGSELTDARGELVNVNYDTVLVPRELERTARQIFDPRAQWEPGSAEFTLNTHSGTVTIVVWDYLTDANAWFAIDSRLMRQALVWQDRVPFELRLAEDFDAIAAKFRGYERYGRGFKLWQFVYGNNPS